MKALISILFVALVAGTAWAQIESAPLPVPAEKIDFAGSWNYATSHHRVSGVCPNGAPMSGTLEITRNGAAVGLMVTSGAVCDPPSMCLYDGAIEDGQLILSNTAVVDEEGGSASNALRLFFTSPTAGSGEAASGYVHPKGFECQWSHRIALWRSD